MAAQRVYSDKEISAVFKRAAELQRTEGSTDTSAVSLAELEQIAAEVGIDPGYVKKAALELEEGRPAETFHLLGGPTSIDAERVVEGEMTEAEWELAVGEFRRVFGAAGKVGKFGRTREWVHAEGHDERVHVTVSPVGMQTRIRVLSRLWVWAVSLHVPFLGVSVAPIAMAYSMLELGPFWETGIAMSALTAFHMTARLIYGSIARKEDRKVRKLLAGFDELIAAPEADLAEQTARKALPEVDRLDVVQRSEENVPGRTSPARRPEREGERR